MALDKNLDNEYRKLNARLVSLYEKFGEDFGLYQEQASIIARNFETRTAPNGAIQIQRGKANADINKFQKSALDAVLQSGSVKSEIASARKYLKEHGQKATKDEINNLILKRDYVKQHRDMISQISEQINAGMAIPDSMKDLYNRAAGRSEELTYDELYDLMKTAEPDYYDMYGA